MVVWGAGEGFLLPLPPFFKHLGGNEGFVHAVAECRTRAADCSVNFLSLQERIFSLRRAQPVDGLRISDERL